MACVIDSECESVIVIVGGGFSGTMVAVHLARLARASSLRIVLCERGSRIARGLAYGTQCKHHLLNVPAAMMSALPDEPAHFLNWLKAKDPGAARHLCTQVDVWRLSGRTASHEFAKRRRADRANPRRGRRSSPWI